MHARRNYVLVCVRPLRSLDTCRSRGIPVALRCACASTELRVRGVLLDLRHDQGKLAKLAFEQEAKGSNGTPSRGTWCQASCARSARCVLIAHALSPFPRVSLAPFPRSCLFPERHWALGTFLNGTGHWGALQDALGSRQLKNNMGAAAGCTHIAFQLGLFWSGLC